MRFAIITDTHFFAEGRGRDGVWWNRTLSSRSLEVGHGIWRFLPPCEQNRPHIYIAGGLDRKKKNMALIG